jgi:hypothetical protein
MMSRHFGTAPSIRFLQLFRRFHHFENLDRFGGKQFDDSARCFRRREKPWKVSATKSS